MARDENGRATWMMQFKEDYEYVDDGNAKCNANDMIVDGNTHTTTRELKTKPLGTSPSIKKSNDTKKPAKMKIKKSIKRSRSTEKHGQLLNTYSELNTCSVELHITECKTSGFCSDPILLKKDMMRNLVHDL